MAPPQILIAGVGNVLQGDDGFGVVVAHRLLALRDLPAGVRVIETGIGGMSLIQEAMSDCDALLIIDACRRGGCPGELYLFDVEVPSRRHLGIRAQQDYFADTHYATPDRALQLLAAIGRLPPNVYVLGCEPAHTDVLSLGLSPPVSAAVLPAIRRIRMCIDRLRGKAGATEHCGGEAAD